MDANIGAGEVGSVGAEVGDAADITQSDIVESADITTQPFDQTISVPLDLGAEVDTTGQTVGSEADIGIEADVEGVSATEDVASDPAPGFKEKHV